MLKLKLPDEAKQLHLQYFEERVLPRMKKECRYKYAFKINKDEDPEESVKKRLGKNGKSLYDKMMDFFLTNTVVDHTETWKILAIGEAKKLLEVKAKLDKNIGLQSKLSSLSNEERKSFFKAVENVFDYKKFSSAAPKRPNLSNGKYWTASLFVEKMGLFVCPYCNQEYIYTVKSAQGKIRTEIDHFMPKSLYPYFSMSLYNFIPAGKSCNQDYKKAKDFNFKNYAYPYRDDYDRSFVVKAVIKDVKRMDIALNLELTEYGCSHAIKCVLDVFRLSERYVAHTKIARDFIIRATAYSEKYINDVISYGLSKTRLNISRKQLKAIFFGYPAERKDIDSCMLGKLKRDLAIQLGLIEG